MNLGGGEVLVILLVALLVLGPTRLPEAARQVGKAARTIRQVSTGFQDEMRHAIEDTIEHDAAKDAGVAYTPASRAGVRRDEASEGEGSEESGRNGATPTNGAAARQGTDGASGAEHRSTTISGPAALRSEPPPPPPPTGPVTISGPAALAGEPQPDVRATFGDTDPASEPTPG